MQNTTRHEIELSCPCVSVGRNCAGCLLVTLGIRPPARRYPVGWTAAQLGGRYSRVRGWLWGITHRDAR